MTEVEQLISSEQYSISHLEKEKILIKSLRELTSYHYERSVAYRRIIDNINENGLKNYGRIADIPYLPVRLFKNIKLQSVSDENILKVLTSSGTSGQSVSRIALDKETSILQVKALASIVTSFLGKKRLPMVIIDSDSTIKNKSSMSARGAGLVGLSNFGRDHFFALDENMELKADLLHEYLEKYKSETVLIFGFTFMVWQYLYNYAMQKNLNFNFGKSILIHSGGWKKLTELSVSNRIFKKTLFDSLGIEKVYNFYGMVEQVGSIFMECENGFLHTPNFADIIIRDHRNWHPLPAGSSGVIQVLSALPKSYPGHSLLTEDMGKLEGIDDCGCGRKGSYFKVEGRIPKAELRGCSDTHAAGVIN